MLREEYEVLSLSALRQMARESGIKGISGLRKAELIDALLEVREKEKAAKEPPARQEEPRPAAYDAGQTEPSANGGRQVSDNRMSASYGSAAPAPAEGRSGADPRAAGAAGRPAPQRRVFDSRMGSGGERMSSGSAYGNQSRTGGGTDRAGTVSRMGSADRGAERGTVTERPAATQEQLSRAEHASNTYDVPLETVAQLDSGVKANGILEVMSDGYGFIRSANYMPGEEDIYVSPSQIRRFNLRTGDIVQGNIRIKTQSEKFSALLYVTSINGFHPSEGQKRFNFDDMTPVFPNERLILERPGGTTAMRVVDLISPIGKGQRGMIVSPPKAGKTTLLKDVAKSILRNSPGMRLIILLIDERPEEVTDIKEAIQGPNVEVIYSTFDETPEHHRRVSEMVIERARRLVEHKNDVTILLDSITRLARAYNLVIPPSGRTLSGGLDPAALHMPKRFFGAARNMREGGSLTILATALVDTGSKMDDVIYEEFKGTGNMELVLDRKLQEKRIFPAIDIQKSGTRREDLLLTKDEQEAVYLMRRALNGLKSEDAVEQILTMFARTRTNAEFVQLVKRQKW